MNSEFSKWLGQRGIDCQAFTQELRDALFAQYEAEKPAPVTSAIVILDGADDDQWQRALRVELVPA